MGMAVRHIEPGLEVGVASLLERIGMNGDSVLPEQYWTHRPPGGLDEGTRNLLLAELEDAISLIQKHGGARRAGRLKREAREAESWIESTNDDGPFAFETICDALGINPECIRDWLHEVQLVRWQKDVQPQHQDETTELTHSGPVHRRAVIIPLLH